MTKHAGGRPKELSKATLVKAAEYLNGGFSVDELVPTIAGLSLYIDCHRSTIYDWSKENQEFSDITIKIMAKQERELLKGGLSGSYNASISKLMLTKHGYSDKQELSGPGGSPIQIQEVKLTIVDPQH